MLVHIQPLLWVLSVSTRMAPYCQHASEMGLSVSSDAIQNNKSCQSQWLFQTVPLIRDPFGSGGGDGGKGREKRRHLNVQPSYSSKCHECCFIRSQRVPRQPGGAAGQRHTDPKTRPASRAGTAKSRSQGTGGITRGASLNP